VLRDSHEGEENKGGICRGGNRPAEARRQYPDAA